MSEIIRQAEKAKAVVADEAAPKWQRVAQGMNALAGVSLGESDPLVGEMLESAIAELRAGCSQHSIETDDDYQRIDDSGLQRM